MNGLGHKIIEKHRQWGTWGLLACLLEKALRKTIRLYFHRYTIYEYNITGKLDIDLDEKYRVAELSYEDFVKQSQLAPTWFNKWKLGMIRRALKKRSNMAIGLFDGELLAAYGLIDYDLFYYTNYKLEDKDAYTWDDYVHPNYRGQRLHRVITQLRINKCLEKGKTRVLSYVDSYNRASHHSHRRIGYKILQTCYIISWWKFTHNSVKYPL